jgi:hypothetical protein
MRLMSSEGVSRSIRLPAVIILNTIWPRSKEAHV